MTDKNKGLPRLSTSSIVNMSMGFLGIQMGFALQNANASRILQSFGADVHQLSWFWLVAPFTGMIVQPIIGYYSDRTWSIRWGRRRPFFLAGALLAAVGLILLPNADMFTAYLPVLMIGAGMLFLMDASFNIAMEPFRALVADKLPTEQRTTGFAVQTVLIGIGAVIGSWLPWVLAEWMGVAKNAEIGNIPANVIISFFAGAAVLVGTILWTIKTTTEYSPEELEDMGVIEKEQEEKKTGLLKDIMNMPVAMKQLGLVQFFSWFALFSMWVFTTPAVAHHVYGLPLDDNSSESYQEAGNWVGVIFGVYNLVSALYAFALPRIAGKLGRKRTHSLSLLAGAAGLISIYFVKDPNYLILSMIGVGIAWASILAMPYAILAGSIPARKMGIYMGLFNFFITFPQIVNGIFGGPIVKYLYGGNPVYSLLTAGVFFILAAISVRFVVDRDDVVVD
jgi:maltose/moltooligosaccharide transporter